MDYVVGILKIRPITPQDKGHQHPRAFRSSNIAERLVAYDKTLLGGDGQLGGSHQEWLRVWLEHHAVLSADYNSREVALQT